MMNEKKPTWTCPVCDGPAKYDDLILDGYFQVEISSALISWYWSVLTIICASGSDQGRWAARGGEWDHFEPGLLSTISQRPDLDKRFHFKRSSSAFHLLFYPRTGPGTQFPKTRRRSGWGRRRRQRRGRMRSAGTRYCLKYNLDGSEDNYHY